MILRKCRSIRFVLVLFQSFYQNCPAFVPLTQSRSHSYPLAQPQPPWVIHLSARYTVPLRASFALALHSLPSPLIPHFHSSPHFRSPNLIPTCKHRQLLYTLSHVLSLSGYQALFHGSNVAFLKSLDPPSSFSFFRYGIHPS